MSRSALIRDLAVWVLSTVWTGMLLGVLGCGADPEPLDANALRGRFPEQAAVILDGPLAFTLAGEGFEAATPRRATDLRARLPRRGEGAVRFELPGGFEVRVREVGASGEGALADKAVAYPRAGGASFWSVTEGGYEEWLLLDAGAVRRDAPVAVWEVEGGTPVQRGPQVEIEDRRGRARIRVTASEAYATGGRPVAARLAAQGATVELWVEAAGEVVLVDPGWKDASDMHRPRFEPTATLLLDGRVFMAGGIGGTYFGMSGFDIRQSAEVFDPAKGSWALIQTPMSDRRYGHTATLLEDGRVLLAGGSSAYDDYGLIDVLDSAEIYDPAADPEDPAAVSWTPIQAMSARRAGHTATSIQMDGQTVVLVVGGYDFVGGDRQVHPSAEIYDPDVASWAPLPEDMTSPRYGHTTTLLPDGRVLVAGGHDGTQALATAEVFDPTTKEWTQIASMTLPRYGHTMTLLQDGEVLVAGGNDDENALASVERYNDEDNIWLPTLVSMRIPRMRHTATRLPDGGVLILGGTTSDDEVAIGDAEEYDPETKRWTSVAPMQQVRAGHTATLLPGDAGVLVAGGGLNQYVPLADAELYDLSVAWTPAAPGPPRMNATATSLEDGQLLVVGGVGKVVGDPCNCSKARADAALYDPNEDLWTPVAPMNDPRSSHRATRLQDGRVLVVGGNSLNRAEVYDPKDPGWTLTGEMTVARRGHILTLLGDGRVLAAGGAPDDVQAVESAEVYDPGTGSWNAVAPMSVPRYWAAGTLLADGRVLVAGGDDGSPILSRSAEVYDPETDAWSGVPPMFAPRMGHTFTRLANGQVLVVGGYADNKAEVQLASAEVYDPTTKSWRIVGSLGTARARHTETLLLNGLVLVTGGEVAAGFETASAEIYDPATEYFTTVEPMAVARQMHVAALLPGGGVLVAGGFGSDVPLDSVEIFYAYPDGAACANPADCRSGFCVEGLCCDSACGGDLCETCAIARGAEADGICTPLHPECSPFACRGGRCVKPCTSAQDCDPGFACSAEGDCVPPPPDRGYRDLGGCAISGSAEADPRAHGAAEMALVAFAALGMLRRRRFVLAALMIPTSIGCGGEDPSRASTAGSSCSGQDIGDFYPATCQQILDTCRGTEDGEYSVYVDHQPEKSWTAHCYGMSGSPAEYLTLGEVELTNFSRQPRSGASEGSDVITKYAKIRIDPATLLVDISDQRYAESEGEFLYESWTIPVTSMPYGVAMTCSEAIGEEGTGNIDLRGTPFAVTPDAFMVDGYGDLEGTADYGEDSQVVDLKARGSCGWMMPIPGYHYPINQAGDFMLELAYVGDR